jgi:hypothetical protein
MKERNRITILDINQSSFLAMNGLEPELVMQSGRVVFSFPADDDFFRLSEAYNANLEVKCLDFVRSLRTLRAKMINAKENDNGMVRREKSFNR